MPAPPNLIFPAGDESPLDDAAQADERSPVPSARDVAEAAMDRLFADGPAAAQQFYRGMLSKVRGAEYPRLRFELVPDPEFPDDQDAAIPTFIDPYTGEETGILIVDRAIRWTENDSIEPDPDEKIISVDYSGCNDGNGFATLVYTSTATGKPVRLPEWWEERGAPSSGSAPANRPGDSSLAALGRRRPLLAPAVNGVPEFDVLTVCCPVTPVSVIPL